MLFNSIQKIVDENPQSTPQLLAVILAGGPFRPFLEKQELLNKAVIMAKQYVADKKSETAKQVGNDQANNNAIRSLANPQSTTNSSQPTGGRVMSLRNLAPPSGPAKA